MAYTSRTKEVEVEAVLLSFEQLSNYVSMGRSRIYALINDESRFPPPIKIGKSSRWLKSEINTWIEAQASQRKTETKD